MFDAPVSIKKYLIQKYKEDSVILGKRGLNPWDFLDFFLLSHFNNGVPIFQCYNPTQGQADCCIPDFVLKDLDLKITIRRGDYLFLYISTWRAFFSNILWLRSIKAFALSIQEKFHPRLKAGDDKILLLEKIDRAFTRISNKNNSLGRFEIDLSLDQLIFEIYGARAFKGLNFDKHKSDFRFMVNALILDGAMVCNGHQAKITPKALEILSTARKNDKRDRRTARINKFVAAVTMIGAIATVVGVIVDAPNSDQLSDKGVIHTLIELLASK